MRQEDCVRRHLELMKFPPWTAPQPMSTLIPTPILIVRRIADGTIMGKYPPASYQLATTIAERWHGTIQLVTPPRDTTAAKTARGDTSPNRPTHRAAFKHRGTIPMPTAGDTGLGGARGRRCHFAISEAGGGVDDLPASPPPQNPQVERDGRIGLPARWIEDGSFGTIRFRPSQEQVPHA